MKTGVIDVGGGLRGIYVAGVFDYCLDKQIKFDYGIGISAGSANLASYMGGQKERNFQFYYEYSSRKEYMGKKEFLLCHSLHQSGLCLWNIKRIRWRKSPGL